MAYQDYLLEKKVFYEELPHHLTKQQFRCLKAIARDGTVSATTSGSFLKSSGVKNASSMQRIIKTPDGKTIYYQRRKCIQTV
jgi:hypothetical protein